LAGYVVKLHVVHFEEPAAFPIASSFRRSARSSGSSAATDGAIGP
jgi:hypothetical protein